MIWIVNIPPEYDGLEVSSPAISYVLHTEPSQAIIDVVADRGGTITALEDPFDGGGDVTVTQDDDETELDDLGDGDYSFDPLDQYETNVEVTIDGGGDVTIKINFTLYQKYNIVTGGEGDALPLYAMSTDAETVYQIDNDDGTSLWDVSSSDFAGVWDGTISNFVCSDDGYLYFFWIGEEGAPIETHTHLVVIDPEGTDAEALDIGSTVHQGWSMIAYDRTTGTLYLEADDFPAFGQTTLYTFSKTGGAIGSTTRDTSSLGYSFSGIAVYNGVVSYVAYDISTGYDAIVCDGVERFTSSSAYMTGDIVAPADGYVYALYDDSGIKLIKIDPASGVEWTYDFGGSSSTVNWSRNLWVNDDGLAMVTLDISGTTTTYLISSGGTLSDSWPVADNRCIDNNLNYFV